MKKRLIGTLLLGALFVSSSSVFVSCKDYDDDIDDLRSQITTNATSLSALVAEKENNLRVEIKALSDQLAGVEKAYAAADNALQIAANDAKTKAENAQATADAAAAAAEAAKNAANGAQSSADAAKVAADAAAATAAEAKAAAKDAADKLDALKTQVAELAAAKTVIEGSIASLQTALDKVQASVDKNTASIAELAAADLELSQAIKTAEANTATALAAAQEAQKKADDLAAQFATLQGTVSDTQKDLQTLQKTVSDNLTTVNAALAKVESELKAQISVISDNLSKLQETTATQQATITALEAKVKSLEESNVSIFALIGTNKEELTKLINDNYVDLHNQIDAAYQDLADKLVEQQKQIDYIINVSLQDIAAAANETAKAAVADAIVKALEDYFTAAQVKEFVNNAIAEANNAQSETLINYVNNRVKQDSTNIRVAVTAEIAQALQAYYTKSQVDVKLNDLKTAYQAADAALNTKYDDAAEAIQLLLNYLTGGSSARAAAASTTPLTDAVKAALEGLNNLTIENIEKEIIESKAFTDAIKKQVDSINAVARLKSIVLRPDTYYGGIEGVSVYSYVLPKEQNENHNGKAGYHYFDRIGTVNISDYGYANYHVNPSNADLDNWNIDFYNWVAEVKEPAAAERTTPTRSGASGGITPVYKTTKELLAANKDNFKNGILTVPFTADAAAIEARLKIGQATIASLAMTGKGNEVADTTVNSDYAIVVPEYGYGLLIGDKTFPVTTRHLDQIGYDGGAVNSSNLHRSFSFLALATTSPTHEIKYDQSFDITAVLESRYVPVKEDYEQEITDTAVYVSHNQHKAIAQWNGTTLRTDEDGDASIDKAKVVTMTPALFEKLGFKYDIQLVNYTLGSNQTGETVHLELITNENGHVIAYPRNVTAAGQTIKGQTANAACVGRQPIVCIMVRDKNNNIVSFAYMKFLITQYDAPAPEEKEVGFEVKDYWVNCKADDHGRVTWSQIEYHILDQALNGMSKSDFDNNYVYDFYYETTELVDQSGATYSKRSRYGIQYDAKGGKRINEASEFGKVVEEWNESAQGIEDATTHIIKWSFTAAQLKNKAEALKAAGKLEDKGDYYVNKEPIVTWVRYAHLAYDPATDAPTVGNKPTKGNPAIWVKLTIPAGEFHVAKGDMGANKILTYWYALNSKTNATGTSDAFEVRINVPVPVPEASATEKTIGYDYPTNAYKFNIRYDNLLEEANQAYVASQRTDYKYSEFTKNLKDFFIDGQLRATVKKSDKFNSIAGMKLGVEFITPSKAIGNATFNAASDGSWTVQGYSGTTYTLKLNADHTKIQIVKRGNGAITPIDLITLNYDDQAAVADRQVTVVNYVNGVDQDDILNYKTHNELGERETFTAYLNIKAINACAPVYWSDMWFNARFIRPLDLEEPRQAVVPDAPNDWHEIDLTDALIVKDWREYYGDRTNSTGGADVKKNIPGVGNVKAFDFAYYQVDIEIKDNAYITDANLGTSQRDGNYTPGQMIRYANQSNFIKTSQVPNLKFEKVDKTKLRYLNNSGVTGGFHVFVPVEMTYVYGHMSVRQTKWITVGVTASVEQAMFE